MEDAKFQTSFMHRVALGLAAAGGLVTAACIAALPGSRCLAVAWVYYHAVTMFGGGAVGALVYVAIDLAPPNVMRYLGRSKKPFIQRQPERMRGDGGKWQFFAILGNAPIDSVGGVVIAV